MKPTRVCCAYMRLHGSAFFFCVPHTGQQCGALNRYILCWRGLSGIKIVFGFVCLLLHHSSSLFSPLRLRHWHVRSLFRASYLYFGGFLGIGIFHCAFVTSIFPQSFLYCAFMACTFSQSFMHELHQPLRNDALIICGFFIIEG